MFRSLVSFALVLLASSLQAQFSKGWPRAIQHIQVRSTADQTDQPALVWSPATDEARPLLVGLHTWSGDYKQSSNGSVFAQWCMDRGWHFVSPNFRGPNSSPAAMGSDLAVQDIVDAVEHLKKTQKVDASRIYLVGASGGGHMSLLMAGRHPEIWAGVSAWCGISDIAAWHAEHLKGGRPDSYGKGIEASLGGAPLGSLLEEAKKRSPLTWLANAKGVPLDINHGVLDGRTGSVPFRHSLLAFNEVAVEPFKVEDILSYYETQQRPASWPAPEPDPLYVAVLRPREKPPAWMPPLPADRPLDQPFDMPRPVVFRQVSGNARITLFDGAHEILYTPALNWLAAQRKGGPPVWTLKDPVIIKFGSTQSGL